MTQGGIVSHHLVGAFLILGKPLDKLKHQTLLSRLCRTDIENTAHLSIQSETNYLLVFHLFDYTKLFETL